MRSGGAFSDEEIQLLRGLPAVSNVTRDRITYSDTFRQVCTIRYLAGESPTKIFREAGLPPELVGYKSFASRNISSAYVPSIFLSPYFSTMDKSQGRSSSLRFFLSFRK